MKNENKKELEKYPPQILMMTLTSFLTLLIPKLLSYLIDDILMANNKRKDTAMVYDYVRSYKSADDNEVLLYYIQPD